jgi:hypothetical protein
MDHRHEGITTTGNVFSVALAAHNRYMTFLGNVFGYTGDSGDYEGTGNCAGGPAIYKIGWPSDCAAGDSAIDAQVRATLLRHGNYDYMTSMTHWESTIADQTIPASLYLGSKPAFFGNRAWPPIGPDLTPMVSPTPAEERFAGMPHSSYGGTDCTP